jgi:hypothetical protein
MGEEPRLVFGPTGTLEEPEKNKVEVFLRTLEGEIHLQIPAPGALVQAEDRVRYMLGVIDQALVQIVEARAREDRDQRLPQRANGVAAPVIGKNPN